MDIYKDINYKGFIDEDSMEVFQNMEYNNCSFDNCYISQTENPVYRSMIRNIRLINCVVKNCNTGTAIIEDVMIDNLRTSGLIQIFGSVFHHVVLKGSIGRIMITNGPVWNLSDEKMTAFLRENEEYYSKVDWALDISEAEFIECDLRGIPAKLIKRDPDTQMVITREKALKGKWKNISFRDGLYLTAIGMFLDREEDDNILIAPKRARNFADLLYDLNLLREAGIVE